MRSASAQIEQSEWGEKTQNAERVFLEAMNEGAVMTSEDGSVRYCNARFSAMVLSPPLSILGMPFERFIPARARPTYALLLQDAKQGDSRGEVALRRADGSETPVLLSIRALDEREKQHCIVVTDLSRLKESQKAERANLERFRQMVAHLPTAVAALDEHDVILEVNELFCELFRIGPHPVDVIGQSRTEFMEKIQANVKNPEEYVRKVQRMIEAKKPVFNEEIIFKDGRILLRDYVPIFENGVYRGQLLLYRDVTQERRVDAAKSEFMSLASHQLRTPLTGIRWTLNILSRALKDALGERERYLLHEGLDATRRMAETIDTMLSISRIESGSVTVVPKTVDLSVLIRTIRDRFGKQLKHHKQAISLHVPGDLAIASDEHLLCEILENLFSNAMKYSPNGSMITVRAERDGEHVRIDVIDKGYGIPPHQQERIFEKFFRAENAVEKVTEGTGLGLYLVRHLVRTLGGTIAFQSEVGRGTTFTLLLPDLPHAA